MLFPNSYSEGEYLRFGNDDRLSNDHASSGTSLLRNGAAGHGESVQKAQTSDHFGPLPNGDGGGRGGRGLSVHRRGSALLVIAPRLRLSFWSRMLKVLPADSTGAVSVG